MSKKPAIPDTIGVEDNAASAVLDALTENVEILTARRGSKIAALGPATGVFVRDQAHTGFSSSSTSYVPFGSFADVAFSHPGGPLLVDVRFACFSGVGGSLGADFRLRVGGDVGPDWKFFINPAGQHYSGSFLRRISSLAAGVYPVGLDVKTNGGQINTDTNDWLQIFCLPLGHYSKINEIIDRLQS